MNTSNSGIIYYPHFQPNKIMSPTTTIEMQTANCFEMAILLVSFLIGCEYNAFVVYGYASEVVCNNDLRKVKIDLEECVCIVYLMQH